jgi:ethanolamine utilization protein EutA
LETLSPTSPALTLIGLDVGTTTTSLMAASARWMRNCVTGRNELGNVETIFRPEPVFTPFRGEALDIDELARRLDGWLAVAKLDPSSVAAGGALVTGLAARSANAEAVKKLVKGRFREAVVAATDDPCLESWLAFMGNAVGLSRAAPDRPVINLDIGGGTANIAWGLGGEVKSCGCYYVGARHIQVEPGTYRVRALSPFARAVFVDQNVDAEIGSELTPKDLAKILDYYVDFLEAAVSGRPLPPREAARLHCQTEFLLPANDSEPVITLSGGVGELAYRQAAGESMPATTAFGDLGIDLAQRIRQSSLLGRNLKTHVPSGLGRATVYGLTLHGTEVSGSTIFLPRPEILPLIDLPILGTIGDSTSDSELLALLRLAGRAGAGAVLRVELEVTDTATVKAFGRRLARQFETEPFPANRPLVLLVTGNIGKTLGQYTTRWGRIATSVVVIDEIPSRRAHFATIGRPHNGLISISYHGLDAQL